MNVSLLWLVRLTTLRRRADDPERVIVMAVRGYVPLVICPQRVSLKCEHEQSAFDTGDLGFE
jgi:hypothetical protein